MAKLRREAAHRKQIGIYFADCRHRDEQRAACKHKIIHLVTKEINKYKIPWEKQAACCIIY